VPGDALGEAKLARARAGDEKAFRELTEPHRRELQLHCYRILGSVQDAEDMVQETFLAAWRSLEAFEGRASVRAWLYRIATNRCLNALRARSRRPRQVPAVPAMDRAPEPTRRFEPIWLEPYPDALLEDIPDRSPGPAARYEARESVELAFIVALQGLPPRQRAAVVLRDVLGFSIAEVAEMLDTGEGSIKGALQRARAALRERLPAPDRDHAPQPNSARERQLVGRFADAFQRGDVDEVVALLTDDALLTMPPWPLEYQGHEAIAGFLGYRAELRGTLLTVPTRANTQPALGCYLPDPEAPIARAYSLVVLTLEGDRIAAITTFPPDAAIFRRFGLPPTLRQGSSPWSRH
jgi:RNA polymerase sigma-70 factor, ECF subfamily